jgi:hypothetical protein
VRGRFRALTAAAIYVIGATIAICAISGVNPVRMLEQSVGMTEAYANTTAGLLTLVLDLGVPYRLAAFLTAIVMGHWVKGSAPCAHRAGDFDCLIFLCDCAGAARAGAGGASVAVRGG